MNHFSIIGSGVGGSVAALELLQNGYTVEIFEEGDEYRNKYNKVIDSLSTMWRNNGINLFYGNPIINFGEGKCVGGSTIINGGVLARTSDEILKNWDKKIKENFFFTSDFFKYCEDIENILIPKFQDLNENISKSSKILINAAIKKKYNIRETKLAYNNLDLPNNMPFGCYKNFKNSLDKNYHKEIKKLGGKIYSRSKVKKIISTNGTAREIIIEDTNTKKLKNINIQNLIISAGPTQTPNLILNNNLARKVNPLNFHLNLKLLCFYNEKLDCHKSSLITHHVREFEKDGVLLMSSSYIKPLIASYMNFQETKKIQYLIDNFQNGTVFNCQIKPDKSFAHIKKTFFNVGTKISWSLHEQDFFKIKKYLKILTELAFISGAKEILLPIENNANICKNIDEAFKKIDNLNKKYLELTSVHAMSSCSMDSNENNIIDNFASLRNFKNIHIFDASILPSNTGQHPQLTTMATVKKLIKKNLNINNFNI